MSDNVTDLERQVCREILKISLEHYPPDHFTLLGISSAIDDTAAVELAARLQAERLRRGTPPELVAAARYVLKRIEKARICLSDGSSRKAYLDLIGKGQVSSTDRTRQTPATSSKASQVGTPARSVSANAPPPVAAQSGSISSEASAANETLTANVHDLSSLFAELAEEEVSSNLIGLTDVPYKSRKASSDQAVVYGSLAAVIVAVLATIGLIASLTGTDPAATPNQIVAESANDVIADAPPPSSIKPMATARKVAPSAPAGSNIVAGPSTVARNLHVDALADSGDSGTALPLVGNASSSSVSSAAEVAFVAPGRQEADPPQTDQPKASSAHRKDLVTEIELPPLKVDQSAATAEEIEDVSDLGYLDEKAANSLRISVDEPYIKQHAYANFYVRRPDQAVGVWEIRMKAEPKTTHPVDAEAKAKAAEEGSQLDGSTVGFDEVIASLTLDSSGLNFRWGQTKRATLAEQLRNCALVLSSESLSHRIQLRPQRLAYKFMFDLSKSNHVFEVADEHLPHADAIRLQIANVQLPGLSFEIEPANGIVEKGDTLRIKTLDGGIPVEFQFLLSVTKSKATVRFVPRHQLGRRWYPFTGEQVHGAIGDLQDALADGRGRLSAARSATSSLPGQLSSLTSRLRADSPDYARIQSQRATIMKQLNAARGTERRLSKSLPEIESKIPQLNSLAALGKRIHMQGRLDFRAYIPLAEGELVLLKTGTEEPPVREKAK
jgi:hypothetical protein